MSDQPQVTKYGLLSMQVCVPKEYTDEQVMAFVKRYEQSVVAEAELAIGRKCPMTHRTGWEIRKEGSPYLQGSPERAQCVERCGCVHIMLDC